MWLERSSIADCALRPRVLILIRRASLAFGARHTPGRRVKPRLTCHARRLRILVVVILASKAYGAPDCCRGVRTRPGRRAVTRRTLCIQVDCITRTSVSCHRFCAHGVQRARTNCLHTRVCQCYGRSRGVCPRRTARITIVRATAVARCRWICVVIMVTSRAGVASQGSSAPSRRVRRVRLRGILRGL